MQIIFIVLKLIGVILASILGLILVTVLLILVVPISYKAYAAKKERVYISFQAGWLFRVLYFTIAYREENLKVKLRLFGFPLMRDKKTKKKRKKRKKNNSKIQPKNENIQKVKKNQGHEEKKTEEYKTAVIVENKESETDTRNIFTKIKNKIFGLYNFLKNFKKRLKAIISRIKYLNKTMELIKAFFEDEVNRSGIKILWRSIKKYKKHIFPKYIGGEVTFGTGDPCFTGLILGLLSIGYSYYGDVFKIVPDFETECLEGRILLKGRISVFIVLIICAKLLSNGQFKQLKINYNKLKEVL